MILYVLFCFDTCSFSGKCNNIKNPIPTQVLVSFQLTLIFRSDIISKSFNSQITSFQLTPPEKERYNLLLFLSHFGFPSISTHAPFQERYNIIILRINKSIPVVSTHAPFQERYNYFIRLLLKKLLMFQLTLLFRSDITGMRKNLHPQDAHRFNSRSFSGAI